MSVVLEVPEVIWTWIIISVGGFWSDACGPLERQQGPSKSAELPHCQVAKRLPSYGSYRISTRHYPSFVALITHPA